MLVFVLETVLETVLASVLLAVESPLTSEFNKIVNSTYNSSTSFCYPYYSLFFSSPEKMVEALAELAESLGCIVALVRSIKMRAERKGKPINTL